MPGATILISIVNYRTPDLAVAALGAIAEEAIARGDVMAVIVDNASSDGSPEKIAEGIAELGGPEGWAELLDRDVNDGFAAGNNAAIARYRERHGSTPDIAWLLNPDTIAEPDALGALVRFLNARPKAGIVGGRVLSPDGSANHSAFNFPSPTGELLAALQLGPLTRAFARHDVAIPIPDAPMRVDWVEGSHMAIRGAVIDAIGPMDTGYFLYFEEVDYCARAADAGFETWHDPSSRVVHIGGQATGITGAATGIGRRPRYWFASRARFFSGRYGKAGLARANALWLLGWPIGSLWEMIRGRPRNAQPGLWRDMWRYGGG